MNITITHRHHHYSIEELGGQDDIVYIYDRIRGLPIRWAFFIFRILNLNCKLRYCNYVKNRSTSQGAPF